MKLEFDSEQINFLNKLNLRFDYSGDLSDDEIDELDDKVSDYFSSNCIGSDDKINQEGLICESIIDLISEL